MLGLRLTWSETYIYFHRNNFVHLYANINFSMYTIIIFALFVYFTIKLKFQPSTKRVLLKVAPEST